MTTFITKIDFSIFFLHKSRFVDSFEKNRDFFKSVTNIAIFENIDWNVYWNLRFF